MSHRCFAHNVASPARSVWLLIAVVTSFPVLRLWKQTRAARDIVEYARAADRWELERDVYRGQYPQMAAQTTFPVGIFLSPLGNVALGLGGGAVGYGVGRTVESN